jgi:alkanesulfonate monooxygenase SsuD/methylene tetrahydromethanopterin reductase-like flavin-dependent oxidoreductase (luciferase family)
MVDIEITHHRPLRLGVATAQGIVWDGAGEPERIRAVDLGDVARKSAKLRREHAGVDVVADIDVVIASEARTARALLDPVRDTGDRTMLYVGTPSGLAGLIADIHALGIADGAVLIPRAPGVAELIRDAVLPALDTMLRLPVSTFHARPA